MSNVKKWIICILALLVIGISLLLLFRVSFVSQPLENVEKIVVVTEPYAGGKNKTINIVDQAEIKHLYGLMKETKIVSVNRYPVHSSSLQFDPNFNIEIEYRNGKKDRYSALSPDCIFRRLDTVTNHGDQGYIAGENEELLQYLLNLQ